MTAAAPALTDVLTTDDALVALAPEWRALWHGHPRATPFQSPDWLLPWWHAFANGARPLVGIHREAGRLVGVLPCYEYRDDAGTKVLPIGVSLSDYIDCLAAPDAPGEPSGVAARLLDAVLASTEAERADLPDLPPGAALLSAPTPRGWRSETTTGEPCPVLSLADEPIEAQLPHSARRNLRLNRNRADTATADWGATALRFATAAEWSGAFDDLVRMHQARWTAQGEVGSFGDERSLRFLRQAARNLTDVARGMLATLRVGSTTAAVVLAFRAPPDRLFLYLSGFEAAFARISPGSLLYADLLEHARREGVREIHFLRGRERYKYGWGAIDRSNTNRHFRR